MISSYRTSKSDTALRALAGYPPTRSEKARTASGPPVLSDDISTPTTEPEVEKYFSFVLKCNLLIYAVNLKYKESKDDETIKAVDTDRKER